MMSEEMLLGILTKLRLGPKQHSHRQQHNQSVLSYSHPIYSRGFNADKAFSTQPMVKFAYTQPIPLTIRTTQTRSGCVRQPIP
jgi:hypothetical protein